MKITFNSFYRVFAPIMFIGGFTVMCNYYRTHPHQHIHFYWNIERNPERVIRDSLNGVIRWKMDEHGAALIRLNPDSLTYRFGTWGTWEINIPNMNFSRLVEEDDSVFKRANNDTIAAKHHGKWYHWKIIPPRRPND